MFAADNSMKPCVGSDQICDDKISCGNLICSYLNNKTDNCFKYTILITDDDFCDPEKNNARWRGSRFSIVWYCNGYWCSWQYNS